MAHKGKENDIEAAGRRLQIRNSTVDFLVFTKDAGEDGIEVRVQNHDVWLTQKAIAKLFDVERSVVTKHLKNLFESRELLEESTCANFAQVADNGRTYQYKLKYIKRQDCKADVSVAKNYLSADEMRELNEIVTMYFDYATRQARRHIPMTMEDWASK